MSRARLVKKDPKILPSIPEVPKEGAVANYDLVEPEKPLQERITSIEMLFEEIRKGTDVETLLRQLGPQRLQALIENAEDLDRLLTTIEPELCNLLWQSLGAEHAVPIILNGGLTNLFNLSVNLFYVEGFSLQGILGQLSEADRRALFFTDDDSKTVSLDEINALLLQELEDNGEISTEMLDTYREILINLIKVLICERVKIVDFNIQLMPLAVAGVRYENAPFRIAGSRESFFATQQALLAFNLYSLETYKSALGNEENRLREWLMNVELRPYMDMSAKKIFESLEKLFIQPKIHLQAPNPGYDGDFSPYIAAHRLLQNK